MKQHNIFPAIILALLCGVPTAAQKLDTHQQEEIVKKINTSTAAMKTLRCDFKQTKKMKMLKKEMLSKGVMHFKSPGKLRWQYNSPYSYIFVLNGNKVSIKSANNTQRIDAQRNKMFRQISNIIMNCVTGANLRNSTDFNVEIWKEKGAYTAKLYPKKKELKSLYNIIKISFNASLSMVESVTMEEKTGDQTIVHLNNIKFNIPISENVFVVN